MKFSIPFKNLNGESKIITAALSAREVESVESLRRAKGEDKANEVASAYALRAAYCEVPRGYKHSQPPTLVAVS